MGRGTRNQRGKAPHSTTTKNVATKRGRRPACEPLTAKQLTKVDLNSQLYFDISLDYRSCTCNWNSSDPCRCATIGDITPDFDGSDLARIALFGTGAKRSDRDSDLTAFAVGVHLDTLDGPQNNQVPRSQWSQDGPIRDADMYVFERRFDYYSEVIRSAVMSEELAELVHGAGRTVLGIASIDQRVEAALARTPYASSVPAGSTFDIVEVPVCEIDVPEPRERDGSGVLGGVEGFAVRDGGRYRLHAGYSGWALDFSLDPGVARNEMRLLVAAPPE